MTINVPAILDAPITCTDKRFTCLKDVTTPYVVVYFYPKDNTPGCSQQARDFTEKQREFADFGAQVIGVSRDSMASHDRFIEKKSLSIPLISDEDSELCDLFDVIKMKSMFGKQYKGIERSTFIISKDGNLVEEFRKVKASGHADLILKRLADLNAD